LHRIPTFGRILDHVIGGKGALAVGQLRQGLLLGLGVHGPFRQPLKVSVWVDSKKGVAEGVLSFP
jgi:hypothetical protein